MYIEYDKEVDAAFIWLVSDIEKYKQEYKSEIWPKELNNRIGLLFTKDSKLLGIEILWASQLLHEVSLALSIPTGKEPETE